MTAFLHHTIDDMRHGRESLRVILFFSLSAFLITTAAHIVVR